jgi:Skp1 family, tetramerisation domain
LGVKTWTFLSCQVDVEIAKQSVTIKTMLEDLGMEEEVKYFANSHTAFGITAEKSCSLRVVIVQQHVA